MFSGLLLGRARGADRACIPAPLNKSLEPEAVTQPLAGHDARSTVFVTSFEFPSPELDQAPYEIAPRVQIVSRPPDHHDDEFTLSLS